MKNQKKHYKQVIVYSVILSLIISFVLLLPYIANNSYARVAGQCSNCHTMHNSQGGDWKDIQSTWTAGESRDNLICNTCVGCHTGTNNGNNTTPYVMGINEPVFIDKENSNTLAGGNFWWVAQGDDDKGHNIFPDNGDDYLDKAPGDMGFASCGSNACHANLHLPAGSSGILYGKSGCQGCHLRTQHHADDTNTNLVNSEKQGWYRFLSKHTFDDSRSSSIGVEGIEHVRWNYGATASSHNEYLGKNQNGGYGFGGNLGNTTTAFCTGCHGNFHTDQRNGEEEDTNPWIRHPSDAVIPHSGEYAQAFGANGTGGTGTYDPNVPVARPSLDGWTESSNIVTPGTDMVMCLSCHVAHGSPYPDMLRWDYATMIAGGEEGKPKNTDGCFKCHTEKN